MTGLDDARQARGPDNSSEEKGRGAVIASIIVVIGTIALILVFRSMPRFVSFIFGGGISLASIIFSFSDHPRKFGWRIAFFVLNILAAAVGWWVVNKLCPGL